MNSSTSILILISVIACGCSTTNEKVENRKFEAPTFTENPSYSERATELKERNSKDDAEAFFENGLKGYIMTKGGLIMVIGDIDIASDLEYYPRDILEFDLEDEPELHRIQMLLTDPAGPVTPSFNDMSNEREHYLQTSVSYAIKFNRRMEELTTK